METRTRYRIESYSQSQDSLSAARHSELLMAIQSLKGTAIPVESISNSAREDSLRDLHEARRLKEELDAISESIEKTKQEIATLHYSGARGQEIARVTDELGAVVVGTESATHTILAAAERIDDLASNLTSRLTGHDHECAKEISDLVIKVFEACNFQDITGQRIGKVVASMRFVEERVHRMIDIWGGIESFKEVECHQDPDRAGDRALLNGPALVTDVGVTSQDDIDALFP